MLLYRCSVCGREVLPAGVHKEWHRSIGPIPTSVLERFCHCRPPRTERSEAVITVDYVDLVKSIREVGNELARKG